VPPTTRLVLASWFKDPPVSLLLNRRVGKGNAPRLCQSFLQDLKYRLESGSVGTRADLALDRADAVVQLTGVIGRMHEAAE
jgi:hypothetical protein